jgi:hypothetical protein
MKNKRKLLIMIVLLTVLVSCKGLQPNSGSASKAPIDLSKVSFETPVYDPAAPPPSPGAAALRALAVINPSVAVLESDVETLERTALIGLIADLKAKTSADIDRQATSTAWLFQQPGNVELSRARNLASGELFLASYKPAHNFTGVINTNNDAAIITAIASGWNDQFTPDVQAGAHVSGSVPETDSNGTTTSSINLGRNSDGSTSFGFGIKTETTKNGVPAKTDSSAQIDGQRCPNEAGQVSFTVKMHLEASSGGSGYAQDLTAFLRTVVNNSAEIESTTIDIQQSSRKSQSGGEVSVASGWTEKSTGSQISNSKYTNVRTDSQSGAQAEVAELSDSGEQAAYTMARTALKFAENNWLDGGCTKIVASSPGTVEPGSTTSIPVTVVQRFDGSVLSAKLEAVLSGEKSIEPTTLAKTPGTLNYSAPKETDKVASIALTASSRRGRAKLKLTVNTGGQAYHVSGESNQVTFSDTNICVNKPFKIRASFPGGGVATTEFTPATGTNGSTSITGYGNGCTQTGGGTYSIVTNKDGSKLLQWTTTDTLTCPENSSTMTGSFELPLVAAPEVACP